METTQTGRPAGFIGRRTVNAINRTGAAVIKGTIAQLNDDFVNATHVGIDAQITDFRRNAVATTADGAVVCTILVALGPIPVDQPGEWGLQLEGEDVRVANGTAAGDLLYVAGAGDTFLTGMADTVAALEALAVPRKIVGRAFEANASGATTTKRARFRGDGMNFGVGYGA